MIVIASMTFFVVSQLDQSWCCTFHPQAPSRHLESWQASQVYRVYIVWVVIVPKVCSSPNIVTMGLVLLLKTCWPSATGNSLNWGSMDMFVKFFFCILLFSFISTFIMHCQSNASPLGYFHSIQYWQHHPYDIYKTFDYFSLIWSSSTLAYKNSYYCRS